MSGTAKVIKAQPAELELSKLDTLKVEPNIIGLGDNLPPEEMLKLATEVGFFNICQRQGFEYQKELNSAYALVESPEHFLEFPVSSIFRPESINSKTEAEYLLMNEKFNSSSQKRPVLGQLQAALEAKGLSQTMMEDVTAVADEFYTNAIYNAPFVDAKTQRNPGISRQEAEIEYEEGRASRLFLASDDTRLVIGCADPFGTLDLKLYLNKIKATYLRGPAATMNFGPGGAGLGSYIIFNTGSSLFFGVWPRQATVLCCVIPLGMSYRKRVQLPKHLHWIQR